MARRGLLLGMASGVLRTKRITITSAVSLGSEFADIIEANVPSGTTWVAIMLDSVDESSFINNQLIIGIWHSSATNGNNTIVRYRNNEYVNVAGSNAFTSGYALTASQNDKYMIMYK